MADFSRLWSACQALAHHFTAAQAPGLLGVWRFLTDPISHALWAGIAGYFIGLAIQQYRRGMVKQAAIALGCTGFVMAATLHGINDWDAVTGHFGWILLTLASVLLFLGYARAGWRISRGRQRGD